MLVRDMNSGRLVMLPDRSTAPLGYNDERLGLPILAALPALAAKALPIITSILPMLKGPSSPPAAASTPPASPPAPLPALPPAPIATAAPPPMPLPMPMMQTIAPSPPVDTASVITPPTATTQTTDVDTEVVVEPVRVQRPDGQMAVVPMRVRRRRRRVRTMRVAPPMLVRPPLPVPFRRYPIY